MIWIVCAMAYCVIAVSFGISGFHLLVILEKKMLPLPSNLLVQSNGQKLQLEETMDAFGKYY